MNEGAADLPTHIGRAVRAIVAGERRLREVAVQSFLRAVVQPASGPLLLAAAVHCEFRLVRDLTERTRFLWYRSSEVKPVVEVTARLTLSPVRSIPGRHIGPSPLRLNTPTFLLPRSTAPVLEITTAQGLLTATFESATEVTIDLRGETLEALDLTGGLGDFRLSAKSMRWVIPLLDCLEAWKRSQGEPEDRGFDPSGTESLRSVIETVISGVRLVIDTAVPGIPEDPPALPLMDEHYALTDGGAQIRLYLDNDGALLEDRTPHDGNDRDVLPEAQQLDLKVQLAESSVDGAVTLDFDFPDFLVKGVVHERILESLVHADTTHSIEAELIAAGLSTLTGSALSAFLRDTGHQATALVIRTGQNLSGRQHDRRNSEDSDLIVLDGMTGETTVRLLLLMEIGFNDDHTTASATCVAALAWSVAGMGWQSGKAHHRVKPYLFRLLRILFGFQQGVRAATRGG